MYCVTQLDKRVTTIESRLQQLKSGVAIKEQDWDNATLMREWGISLRTAANYRKQGLNYYKRGGRVYYSPEDRIKFVELQNMKPLKKDKEKKHTINELRTFK